MKPHTPSRKLGTLILSSLALAGVVLAIFQFNQYSGTKNHGTAVDSRSASGTSSKPRLLPPSTEAVTAAAEREATANARPCDNTVLTHLDLTRPPTEAELIAAGNLGKKLTPTRNADFGKIGDPSERNR